MNVKAMMGTVGKTAKTVGNTVLDGAMKGVNQIESRTDLLGDAVGRKIISKTGDVLFDESVQGFGRKAAQFANNNAVRIGHAVGGGAEGLIVGAAGGALVGGVSGGIDKDETFLGGMGKGALAGAGIGFAASATSAYVHNSSGLLTNALNDHEVIAARIAKWKANMGDGISNIRTKANNYGNIFDPKVQGVL